MLSGGYFVGAGSRIPRLARLHCTSKVVHNTVQLLSLKRQQMLSLVGIIEFGISAPDYPIITKSTIIFFAENLIFCENINIIRSKLYLCRHLILESMNQYTYLLVKSLMDVQIVLIDLHLQ